MSDLNELPSVTIEIDETLRYYLEQITAILSKDGLTELCINEPCVIWYEQNNEWHKVDAPFYTPENLSTLFNHIANATKQNITEEYPIVSASLQTGERVQLVKPPSAISYSLTIRKPSKMRLTLEQLSDYGAFSFIKKRYLSTIPPELEDADSLEVRLLKLLHNKDYVNFFREAVKGKKNIIVSGATGSGKTTFTNSLIQEIPDNERIITIEDVPELSIQQPNHVSLIYSKDARSITLTTPKILLESCLRMRPDRILLAELRGEEAFYYVRNVNSGHPGSITSIHATSAPLAFEQLMLYVKESEAGSSLSSGDIRTLLHILVNIVVQYARLPNGKRVVTEIYFDPFNNYVDPLHKAAAA